MTEEEESGRKRRPNNKIQNTKMIVGQEWGGYRNWPGWSGACSTALAEIRWGVERVERGGRAALSPNLLVFWTIPGTLCTAG